ncbi:valine--tRNA ligase [Mesoaciditoga sp.]
MQTVSCLFVNKSYSPEDIEKKWYEKWKENGVFKPEKGNGKFSMVIPPPNITGQLHMGHALNIVVQDIITRYNRMKGKETLWLPGEDHAGIATQNVVVKKLDKEGKTKEEIGRKKFTEVTWEWANEYRKRIRAQIESMGASCDWSRERFTLDEGLNKAVKKVFVSLYKKGLIYKGKYMVNWCPKCGTVLSNEEIEYEDEKGKLYHVRYPIDGGGEVVIATTRPETMLGDTAIAVNPNDVRYKNIVGKWAILPLVGRKIPIIADEYVDTTFGTGALKVTPAHDPNDFEIGKRHDLETIDIFDDEAKINFDSPYKGMSREEAREAIVRDLEKEGYLVKVEDYVHSVGHCYRCHTAVEPKLSDQWFVKMKPLAEPAIKAVKDGSVKFHPDRWKKVYLNWMENVRDWCISRQLWWGHRIPVWYCKDCGHITVSEDEPHACEACGSTNIVQDEDVLDTWFSSALWPFSTLGWPENTKDLKKYYPTDLLVTGFDIIFFWVARMIVMGLEFMGDVPFHDVYIHQLVRDKYGRKMSKSLGNGIDPIEVVNEYGADAMRITLAMLAAQGRDINLDERAFESFKHFSNKIWNAARFVKMNVEGVEYELPEAKTAADRWILSKLNSAITEVSEAIESYDLNQAAHAIYNFFWGDFCDWYIEISKVQMKNALYSENTKRVLLHVLRTSVQLLHPFMPFITEEVWSNFFEGFVAKSTWPQKRKEYDFKEEGFEFILSAIKGIRSVKAELELPPSEKVRVAYIGEDDLFVEESIKEYILKLANVSTIEKVEKRPTHSMTAAVGLKNEIFVVMNEEFDISSEIERLHKKIEKLKRDFEKAEKKISNPNFLNKAPQEIVQKVKNERDELGQKIEKLKKTIEELER